ncbi:phosphoenolpyruvate---glycerone phosphotransferase subunit DhaL [Staphylococcus pasteuri]|uniref:Dihydroxyacetone kinase, C-terminal domain n=2 Tax=Staphylococcus TaxID=1279 RepID=A0ABY1H7N8_9STAP|nr:MULTISPECIES: dihydroxyacetone kinase subunit DhaL [Staphylococcus]ATH63337.1 dihydroxyacetone kinase subunit L [Staphylococcus pasteuri]KKI56701.1 Phosphoenolpyruvate-dihydroxyacetone phosphotransferase [Staphylococcus pasteuri]MCF7600445.1 dihydroxyacetone kinase subunit L [Staphylococcus pasteuri]MDI3232799.1 dihydroxyacetone kinase subunit DhaL [Staphylococcus pasteuri]MDO6573156.1 dihydroxyacetone kinase subunit DhaL [Staphylococcus pasteuri_A]
MNINTTKQHLLELENTFKEQEDTLTELDRAIGDGDHGVNMLRGFENLKDKVDDSSMKNLFKSTGMTLMSNIGGASGPLYGFSFVKMAEVVSDDIDHDNLVTLLETFTEAIAKRGKVELNEKTMYDVVARTFEAVKADEKVNLERLQSFADETIDMVATKGRASYYKEASKGYMDPGAQSMVYVLNALIGDER